MTSITKDDQAVSGGSRCCSRCKITMHESYFGFRPDRPGKRLSLCRACQRERQKAWVRAKRGTPVSNYEPIRCADTAVIAARLAEAAANLRPGLTGISVCRMPDGEVRYWRGPRIAPREAEFIGVYDFEATPEHILEDLAA